MLDAFWTFVKDPANRETLGWIGGGIVVVVGGLWAVVTFFAGKGDGGPKASVTATHGSVAAGRNISNSPITTNSTTTGGQPRRR